MKFLVDAQFPQRFAGWLRDAGHDARHTLELPEQNRMRLRPRTPNPYTVAGFTLQEALTPTALEDKALRMAPGAALGEDARS